MGQRDGVESGWRLGQRTQAAHYRKFGDKAEDMLKFYVPDYPFADNPSIIRNDELPIAPQPVANNFEQPIVAPGTDLAHVATDLVGGLTHDSLTQIAALYHDAGLGSNNWVIRGKPYGIGQAIAGERSSPQHPNALDLVSGRAALQPSQHCVSIRCGGVHLPRRPRRGDRSQCADRVGRHQRGARYARLVHHQGRSK